MTIQNWIMGAVIGLVLCLIIVLILQNTVFKDSNMKILYIVMFVLFAFCGGLVQSKICAVHAESAPTPKEQIEEIDKTVKENWKNTNGGFTFEQIEKSQNDDECPSYDDQIIDLKCYDFGAYTVFSYEADGRYNNTLFYKSNNGLIVDGMINTYASLTGVKWFFAYDLSTFNWVQEMNKEPYYWDYYTFFDWRKLNGNHDDLVSVSRQTQEFVKWTHAARTNQDEMVRYVMTNAATLAAKNVTSYFIKFKDVELIGTKDTALVKINSLYNYLYEQIKGEEYGTTKLVDTSTSMCLPIPTVEQTKYPIPASKQADYGDAKYYGVYRCNIAVNLTYLKGENLTSTTKNEDYVEQIQEDDTVKDKVTVETIIPRYIFSKLTINFVDTKNSDFTNFNLMQAPVKITLTCTEDSSLSKTIVIDSLDKLNKGVDVLLTKNTSWEYYIESNSLIFEEFRGTFTIKSNSNHISFNYYYLNNYTIASVGLNPIGTIDTSKIDLFENPVKVILSNDNNTYQFVFSDNSELNTQKYMLVELGEYTYTILSKQLLFTKVTGKLTITTTDKNMLFNYALGSDDEISFKITMASNGTSNKCFTLYSASSNVDIVRKYLTSSKVYIVTCVIYDQDGKLMETFTHTHQSTGTCGDTWYASNLTANTQYTLQLRFADRDDSTITYLSDIAVFTYSDNTTFKVTYDVTENI